MSALNWVCRVYHQTLGNLWWGSHRVVEAPLYLVPRTEVGERVYTLLWAVCGGPITDSTNATPAHCWDSILSTLTTGKGQN